MGPTTPDFPKCGKCPALPAHPRARQRTQRGGRFVHRGRPADEPSPSRVVAGSASASVCAAVQAATMRRALERGASATGAGGAPPAPPAYPPRPSTARSFAASSFMVKGLTMSCTPESSTPLWMMALRL